MPFPPGSQPVLDEDRARAARRAQQPQLPTAPDDRSFTDKVIGALRAAPSVAHAAVGEVVAPFMGQPGTTYGDATRDLLAGVRGLVPWMGTAPEEREAIRRWDERRNPDSTSVIPEVSDVARRRDQLARIKEFASPEVGLITAHASPIQKFTGKPKLTALGTGEGGQMRGRGIYASVPENGLGLDETYRVGLLDRKNLPRTTLTIPGEDFLGAGPHFELRGALDDLARSEPHLAAQLVKQSGPESDRAMMELLSQLRAKLQDRLADAWRKRHTPDLMDSVLGADVGATLRRGDVRSAVDTLRFTRAADLSAKPNGSFHIWEIPDKNILQMWKTVREDPENFARWTSALPPATRDRLTDFMEQATLKYEGQAAERAARTELERKAMVLRARIAVDGDNPARASEVANLKGQLYSLESKIARIGPLSDDPNTFVQENLIELLRTGASGRVKRTDLGDVGFRPSIPGSGVLSAEEMRRALSKEAGYHSLEYLGESGSLSRTLKGSGQLDPRAWNDQQIQNYIIMQPGKAVKPLGTFPSYDDYVRSSLWDDLRGTVNFEQAKRREELQRYGHWVLDD